MSVPLRIATALLLMSAAAALADNVRGTWSSVGNWPLIAVHAVLTADGRVLTYGTDGNGLQTGLFIYDVWDPAAGLAGGHLTLPNSTNTDIFCSSQVLLPQSGDVFIAGGDNFVNGATTNTGNNNSNIFAPANNSLTRGNNLNRARWYSSSTTLINGETYIQGGNGGTDRPEIRDASGVLRLLTGASTSTLAALFPRNFIAPDGRVFGFDNTGKTYYVTTEGNGSFTQVGQLPGVTIWTSSPVMFQPGRILQIGGASSSAYVIDINGPTPVVTTTQSNSSQRQWVSATVIADGRVVATGGSAVENQLTGVNNVAEIWNPNTGQWTQGTAGQNARLYHSTALLLPDATVLVAGGGAPGPLTNLNAELYRPPYLYDSNGALAARPSIVSAPSAINIGEIFSVSVTGTISRVTLVKTGSASHSFNMDQRFLELSFSTAGSVLNVNSPVRAADAPPGYYLLFVINAQGVPSVAKIVRMNIEGSPPPPVTDSTQTIGGSGGTTFQLVCNADEVLVGAYGSTGSYVNQVGPRCVRLDSNGQWSGTPVNRGLAGALVGTKTYTRTCPTNFAVSGFSGRAANYVNQITLQCKALTSQGKLTGTAQSLAAFGGSGGTAQGPFDCGTGNPGYAFFGRAGSFVDNFGMQCRHDGASVNNPPVLMNPRDQTGTVGVPVDLQVTASDPDGNPLTYSASGLPPGLGINASTGRITGNPTTDGVYTVSVGVNDGMLSTMAGFSWTIVQPQSSSFVLDPLPLATPKLADTPVTYTASASGTNVVYSWYFDDGTPQTPFSSSPSITHTFANPGVYYVTVTASQAGSPQQMQTVAQMIHLPLTSQRPTVSANIAYEARGAGRIWVVNQDNNSVSVIDAATNKRLKEITVGTAPRAVAIAPNGRIWVTNKIKRSINIIDPATLTIVNEIWPPQQSQPFGIAFAPAGDFAYLVLETPGTLLKLDAVTGAQLGSLAIGANPRHVAVSGDGTRVYVSRFITPPLPGESTASVQPNAGGAAHGGEVLVVNPATMSVIDTIVLHVSTKPDFENQGSGAPNYLGPAVISPDGVAAWVPSKQDNILRGTLRNGSNLNFQNTVRAVTSRIVLSTRQEDSAARIDHNDSGVASAVAFDPYGVYMFVALETSREVAVVDAHGEWEIFRFDVGRAPQGLAVSPDGTRLYVNNFMDRTLDVFDLTRLINLGESNVPAVATVRTIGTDKLSASVLKGKQFFYDARDTRLAEDRYISCASCHNDGGQDGRVWDLTGFGEGLRNTIALRGRAGAQGFLHWSGNFDEVQDFEGQIRALSGGTGLMTDAAFNTGTRSQPLGTTKAGVSADLDALAAYVASLNTFERSPYRESGGLLSSAAVKGKTVFRNANCAQCHSGTPFTESGAATLRNIGTLKPSSGKRLGAVLLGIDTPTLRDVWATAPYLHDGSAATLADAVTAHSGVTVTGTNLANLVEYLKQIGSQESTAPTP